MEQFARQVTVDARGEAPETGARVTQPGVVVMTPEGVDEAADAAENSPQLSGIDPCEDGVAVEDVDNLYEEVEHCEDASHGALQGVPGDFEGRSQGRTQGPGENQGLVGLGEVQHGLGMMNQ